MDKKLDEMIVSTEDDCEKQKVIAELRAMLESADYSFIVDSDGTVKTLCKSIDLSEQGSIPVPKTRDF